MPNANDGELLKAAKAGDLDRVERAIEAGANVLLHAMLERAQS